MMEQALARKLWIDAVEKIKDRTVLPSLWSALDVSHGITLDGDKFIVGFTSMDYPQASLLRSAQNKVVIDKVLAELTSRPSVQLKTIEGIYVDDYENIRQREEAFEARKKVAEQKKESVRAASRVWDDTLEQILSKQPGRSKRILPQVQAKFVMDALSTISKLMDEHRGAAFDETAQKALGRAIDKIAAAVDAPPVYVAMELQRMRNGS
jgi:hypothetical protein